MKRACAASAAALLLVLTGCGSASEPEHTPPQKESKTAEQLLKEQPRDSSHDAFLVETGGRMGTLLVTAEKGEPDKTSEFGGFETTLSVWDPQTMDKPLQTMTIVIEDMCFGHSEVTDANFDGLMDFGSMYFQGNQPTYWYFWIWDEEAGQFVEEPAFREISMPVFDPETETVSGWARSSGAGDGLSTFYRWEDEELVCVRKITVWYEPDDVVITESELAEISYQMTVEDRIDGALVQVYYNRFPSEEGFFAEREKWENLDYHGEMNDIEE